MTHGINGHETAAYMMQTGHAPAVGLVYPSLGAIVSLFKGYDHGYTGLIPPYVVLTEGQGRFSEEGFLGPRYKPFVTGGDPSQKQFAVEGIVAAGISDQRQHDRRDLLHALDSLGNAMPDNPVFASLNKCEDKAYDLILGDTRKVFDLSQESDAMRDKYGRNWFGQSCLVARRLVEHGVPYITINYKGWDTHKQHFPDHEPASCRRWTRGWPRSCRTCPTAGCWIPRSSGGAASSAGLRKSSGKRPGTEAGGILAIASPSWLPAVGSRAVSGRGIGRDGRECDGAPRAPRGPSRKHFGAARNRSRRPAAERSRAGRQGHAFGGQWAGMRQAKGDNVGRRSMAMKSIKYASGLLFVPKLGRLRERPLGRIEPVEYGTIKSSRGMRISLLIGLVACMAAPCGAQDAYIGYVYPAGGQQGTVFQVTVRGQRLEECRRRRTSPVPGCVPRSLIIREPPDL